MSHSSVPPAPAPDAPAVPDRPLGLNLLIWLLFFWAGAIALVFLGFTVGDGPVMLNGRAVPRGEALMAVLPTLLPMGLAAVGAAFALALDRPWARAVVLLPFVLATMAPAFTGAPGAPRDLLFTALTLLPVGALVAWYLFFNAGVNAHFARLREARRPSGGGPGPQRG